MHVIIIILEVLDIKNITLRVDDDFHYSVKTYAAKQGLTLQKYMIDVVTRDLEANNAYTKSPIAELVDNMSDDEIVEMLKRIKEKKDTQKK